MNAHCTTIDSPTAARAIARSTSSAARRSKPRRRARSTLKSLSDAELVKRLLAGDEVVFSQLVDQFHASLVRLAQSFVGSRAVAEEVAQETWLAVIKGLDRFEGRSSLKNWIFRILTNRAKTRGVREGRMIPFSAVGKDDSKSDPPIKDRFDSNGRWSQPPEPWHHSPERRLLAGELGGVIYRAIDGLPDKQRAVITLRDVQGLGSKEVQELLDVSETYQRVLLHRARTKVRSALAPYLT